MPTTFLRLTPEEVAARKRRNVWIALGLVAFIVLLFTTTFLRMMHNQKVAHEANAAMATSAPVNARGQMSPPSTVSGQ